MDYLDILSKIFDGLGTIGLFVVVVALYKLGFFDKKNGNGKIADFREELNSLKENHLPHLEAKMDKANDSLSRLEEGQQKSNELLTEIKVTLRERNE